MILECVTNTPITRAFQAAGLKVAGLLPDNFAKTRQITKIVVAILLAECFGAILGIGCAFALIKGLSLLQISSPPLLMITARKVGMLLSTLIQIPILIKAESLERFSSPASQAQQ